jgi:hypothetical protein
MKWWWGLLCTRPTPLIGFLYLKINLFSLWWYSWKIAEMALNNNHSLNYYKTSLTTHSLITCFLKYHHPLVASLLHLSREVTPTKNSFILLISIQQNLNSFNKVCQWLPAGWWFSPDTSVSSTNKTDRHNKTEILLKVALNTINQLNSFNWIVATLPLFDTFFLVLL